MLCDTQQADNTKATGILTKEKVKVSNDSQTETPTSVVLFKINPMGKEFTHGRTVKSRMDNGGEESNKDTEYGED